MCACVCDESHLPKLLPAKAPFVVNLKSSFPNVGTFAPPTHLFPAGKIGNCIEYSSISDPSEPQQELFFSIGEMNIGSILPKEGSYRF